MIAWALLVHMDDVTPGSLDCDQATGRTGPQLAGSRICRSRERLRPQRRSMRSFREASPPAQSPSPSSASKVAGEIEFSSRTGRASSAMTRSTRLSSMTLEPLSSMYSWLNMAFSRYLDSLKPPVGKTRRR